MGALDVGAVLTLSECLVVAAVLGGLIGIQRQVTGKVAGFRTHLLVAVGSCAFTEVSRLAGDTRIAAGVITGIGFLGAGAIVREGPTPRGLTTAASIWCAAAVGLCSGFGTPNDFALAVVTTVLVLAALITSDANLERIFPPHDSLDACVIFDADALTVEDVHGLFTAQGVHAKKSLELSIERRDLHRYARWRLTLRAKHGGRLRDAILEVSKNPAIRAVEAGGEPVG